MSGRLGYGDKYCREAVKQNATRMQCLKTAKIQFGPVELERTNTYVGTIDCVHYETNEFRTDPDSKRYSHKHNGAGVSYEVAIDFYDDKIIWIASPFILQAPMT